MILAFIVTVYDSVIFFLLSYFLLIRSFHQKVYVHVEEHVFLFHMHTSAEHLLGQGLGGNNKWDHEALSAISLTVSCNNLDLGWNTAADLQVHLLSNIDCLANRVYVWCIPF